MDLKILPNEVYVTEHGALIRTRCPKDRITTEMIHQRVVSANLSAGDIVKVQCFNHEYNTVLHFSEYLVYDRSSYIRRIEVDDRETRQVEDIRYSVIRMTPWQDTPAAPKTIAPEIKWNPGRKAFQVILRDEVIGESPDKEEANKIAIGAA